MKKNKSNNEIFKLNRNKKDNQNNTFENNNSKSNKSDNNNDNKKIFIKNILILVIVSFLISLISIYNNNSFYQLKNQKTFSDIVSLYNSGAIKTILVEGTDLIVTTTTGMVIYSKKEPFYNITENFDPQKVIINIKEKPDNRYLWDIFTIIFPFILVILFFVWMSKRLRKNIGIGGLSGSIFDNQFSANQLVQKPDIKFKDVAGNKEAKEDLWEVVDFLKNPTKYIKMGASIPKGVLMIGPPGTGKTLLAKAIAGEADVPFFHISGSDFEEMFVGVGAARVRELFSKAKKNSPSIIFIDEIDAVGKQRGNKTTTNHSEQTLNQILVEMDGFGTDSSVIVIAATNRPDVLDPALLRPGRFDRRITLDIPNIIEREEILEVHSRNKPLDKDVNLKEVAKHTSGFSGADLSNLMNEAAILATKKGKKRISMQDIDESIEKIVMGPEKKTKVVSEEEKRIIAYHEAGHAYIGHVLPKCDIVHKITIVSRGMSLGSTWFKPQEDKRLISESKFKDEICSLLGGYIAEKLFIGENTTGASNDLQRATAIAKAMVTDYGMSKKLSPVVYKDTTSTILGEITKSYSDETLKTIEDEISNIINEQLERGIKILSENKDKIEKIVNVLIEKETITHEEFVSIINE